MPYRTLLKPLLFVSILVIVNVATASNDKPHPDHENMTKCHRVKLMLQLIDKMKQRGDDNDYLARLKKEKVTQQLLYFEWQCDRYWRGLNFD